MEPHTEAIPSCGPGFAHDQAANRFLPAIPDTSPRQAFHRDQFHPGEIARNVPEFAFPKTPRCGNYTRQSRHLVDSRLCQACSALQANAPCRFFHNSPIKCCAPCTHQRELFLSDQISNFSRMPAITRHVLHSPLRIHASSAPCGSFPSRIQGSAGL